MTEQTPSPTPRAAWGTTAAAALDLFVFVLIAQANTPLRLLTFFGLRWGRMIRIVLFSLIFAFGTESILAGVNVLVIGSTHHFDQKELGKPDDWLDPAEMAKSLQDILNQGRNRPDGSRVVFEEVHRTKSTPVALGAAAKEIPTEFHCHSLAQFYFWPDGRDDRLKLLSSDGATQWNYVVLVGDPYLICHMPGIYAEGIYLLAEQIKKSEAKILLLMPWTSDPEETRQIGEVVCRVGQRLDLPVAPAGEAWVEAGAPAKQDPAYLAAASVFSTLSGRKAWGSGLLAQSALAAVTSNQSKPAYTESFSAPNPFLMDSVAKDIITFNQTGTSSEAGIRGGLMAAAKQCGIQLQEVKKPDTKIDFNYGRGNTNFEPDKRYKVDPSKFHRSYGFPMQEQKKSAAVSMLYGIDKRYFNAHSLDDGTDLGIAYDMIRDDEVKHNVCAVPIRLLWARLHEADPSMSPLSDNWHMNKDLNAATGSFMITLLTGRNPVGDEPSDPASSNWKLWQGRKIGYETAMRMALR